VPSWYTGAAVMMEEERLDFVDIVTTMPAHKLLVLLAARHRLPAIVQKPIALPWCFQSPMLEVRHVLAGGAIGEATWARISWRTGYDIHAGQRYLARDERFILLDIGVHVLDLARVLLGEVERVYCERQSVRAGIAGVAALRSRRAWSCGSRATAER
jgi:predicted dehydrogenase